ncbi:MAG: hypothetical protein MUP58_03450 [Candidatus Nanohaloarchaeota archaeon QJJ-9]|nr:hypothetical protein [Candidatus Nanohaloarchaeota archaeon QJJ-9]
MKKILIILGILAFFTIVAQGVVSSEVEVRNSTARVNSTFNLYAEEETNYWNTEWQIPEKAEIISIKDSLGEIENYERIGGAISFETNRGDRRNRETVKVSYKIPNAIKTWQDEVKVLQLQISGFNDRYEEYDEEKTYARVEVPEKVLGTSENLGFRSSFEGGAANFSGEGPLNFKVTYTDLESNYTHFIPVSPVNLSEADRLYPILESFTGRKADFRKFAVMTLPEGEYGEKLEAWSDGRYKKGGLIFIKESRANDSRFTGLVLHEAMHGFNQRPMKWVRTRSTMFDEGSSRFIETYVNQKKGLHTSELFGNDTIWRGECEGKEGYCRLTLPPRGTSEQLWEYYKENKSFMMGWTPSESGSVTFGYAYGELIVRQLFVEKGAVGIREAYNRLEEVETPVKNSEEYWQGLKETLKTDLEPCKSSEKQKLVQCIKEANSELSKIPSDVDIGEEEENVNYTELDPEGAGETGENVAENSTRNITEPDMLEEGIESFLERIRNWLRKVLKLFNR